MSESVKIISPIDGSVYAERPGHPRIFLVGTGLLSALERVFYQADQLARTQ